MRNIKLTIEYDGTDYVGWQIQSNGPSIQQAVEKALSQINSVPVQVVSSGRTDAGVHARCMVVHFMTEDTLPISAFCAGINTCLPDDISVISAEEVENDFHARYDALAKKYRYTIYQSLISSPLSSRYSWRVKNDLDLDSMNKAASYLVGKHDFAAFRSSGCDAKNTVRDIYSASLKKHGRFIYFDIVGRGFLRNMIRIIIGTLVEVGKGARPPEYLSDQLQNGQRNLSGVTAPPQGLCLMQIWYDGNPEEWRVGSKPCNSCQKSLDKQC